MLDRSAAKISKERDADAELCAAECPPARHVITLPFVKNETVHKGANRLVQDIRQEWG